MCSGGHGFDSCRGLRYFSLSHARVMLNNSSFISSHPLYSCNKAHHRYGRIATIEAALHSYLHQDFVVLNGKLANYGITKSVQFRQFFEVCTNYSICKAKKNRSNISAAF